MFSLTNCAPHRALVRFDRTKPLGAKGSLEDNLSHQCVELLPNLTANMAFIRKFVPTKLHQSVLPVVDDDSNVMRRLLYSLPVLVCYFHTLRPDSRIISYINLLSSEITGFTRLTMFNV